MKVGDGALDEGLETIKRARDGLVSQAEALEELPDNLPVLEIESRAGDDRRIYMHIVQMCTLHMAHFVASNRIKHIYLIEGFLFACGHGNPPALYAASRAMFEHNAFLHQVQKRLGETFDQANEKNWRPCGEKYFGLTVRARFATSDPEKLGALTAAGFSPRRLKPFNITECVRALKTVDGHGDAKTRYAYLSDFVHHNLGSVSTTVSGRRTTDFVDYGSGGILSAQEGQWLQYRYPIVAGAAPDQAALAPDFVRDLEACQTWINSMPHMPFSKELNLRHTGHELAAAIIYPNGRAS